MSPPSQPGSRLPSPPTARSTWSAHRPPPIDIEKAQHLPQNPSNLQGPNLQHHPANYAPFAEPVPQQPAAMFPNSPGPLPAKVDYSAQGNAQEHENSQQKLTIVPDANPLQSPKIPYFPPPVTTPAPQVPTGNDLATYHRPGQISHPNQEIRGGGWTHGLCDCSSSIGTCCLGLVCPCILYGKTSHRLSMRSRKEDPTNMLGYETCNGSCTAMALLCGCQWLLATIQHTRIRRAYAIQGSIASDCVRATCCTCCTLIQDEKEIRKREEERARAARASGAALVSPYLAPVPMSYGPPQR